MEFQFDVSICVLTLNQLNYTKKCLNSLLATTFKGALQIIIVDNASQDGTQMWLQQFQRQYSKENFLISLILNPDNFGCTEGRNQACRAASGEFIVFLDNDTEIIQPDWLQRLYDYYNANKSEKRIGILGVKLLYPDNPNLIQHAGIGVTAKGKIGYWGQGKNREDVKFNEIRDVQACAAACWFVKKDIFLKFGYFDNLFFPVNYEDIDFCYRIREKGYRVVYFPLVELYHSDHRTTKNTAQISFMHTTIRNGQKFKKRWKHIFEKENEMQEQDINWI